jgi:putative polyhydroxyalkanoate system protein
MPSIKMSIPHNLTRQQAAERLKNMAEQVKKQYGNMVQNLKESWSGETGNFSFTIMGMDVSGTVHVEDHEVNMDSQIPFAALAFKGRIESVLREKMTELLV